MSSRQVFSVKFVPSTLPEVKVSVTSDRLLLKTWQLYYKSSFAHFD